MPPICQIHFQHARPIASQSYLPKVRFAVVPTIIPNRLKPVPAPNQEERSQSYSPWLLNLSILVPVPKNIQWLSALHQQHSSPQYPNSYLPLFTFHFSLFTSPSLHLCQHCFCHRLGLDFLCCHHRSDCLWLEPNAHCQGLVCYSSAPVYHYQPQAFHCREPA
jgi:hypothetical protein